MNNDYKLDSVLSHTDGHVVSGSEDGRICVWDLVEVSAVDVVCNVQLFSVFLQSHQLHQLFRAVVESK